MHVPLLFPPIELDMARTPSVGLKRLPTDYATAVRLYDLERRSAAEVAAEMGHPAFFAQRGETDIDRQMTGTRNGPVWPADIAVREYGSDSPA